MYLLKTRFKSERIVKKNEAAAKIPVRVRGRVVPIEVKQPVVGVVVIVTTNIGRVKTRVRVHVIANIKK